MESLIVRLEIMFYNLKDFVINDGLELALDIWGRDGYSFCYCYQSRRNS